MSQIIYPITHLPPVIDIGKQTEKGVTRIGFDVHEWLDDWPGMAFSVQPTRPGETESYFAASEMVGSVVFWLVGAVDTEKPGSGTVEVLGVTEDERKLSFMCRTSIANTNTATVAEVPEPNKPWVDQVILAGETAKADAKEAAESASNAAQSEQSAGKSEQAAATAATQACQSANAAAKSVQDIFVVKVDRNQMCSHTKQEIVGAASSGKVCLMVYYNGEVLKYKGLTEHGDETTCPYFVGSLYKYGNEWYAAKVTVLSDNKTVFDGSNIRVANPNVLRFKGAVEATYNGKEHVVVEIPSSSLPETADPLKQLVTDESGKVVWEDRLAYKTTAEVEVVNLAPTELTVGSGDVTNDLFFLFSPWAVDIEAGKTYSINFNGTTYVCKAMELPTNVPETPGMLLMGNFVEEGFEGSNPDAPFSLATVNNGTAESDMNGIYAMLVSTDGATAVTLSVTSKQTQTTVKTIDQEYLPPDAKRKTITMTFDDDGNLTSDTDFETAWAMDAAQLQAAIVIADTGLLTTGFSGPRSSASYQVTKAEAVSSGATLRQIQIQYGKKMLDLSDAPSPCTYYIDWTSYGGKIALTKSNHRQQGMPIDAGNISAGMYLRHSGSRWVAVTIDQLKADLGLT